MHSYDADGRSRAVAALTVGSLFLVWVLHLALEIIDFRPQWWLSVPSFAGFYSAFYWLFDRYVWRWGILRRVGLLALPDLNGLWKGEINSSYVERPATSVAVEILQRWSKLVVTLETEDSRSRSIAATFRTEDVPRPELSYLYINEPKATAAESMQSHRGTVTLELVGDCLEGDYYSGRGRREIGTLKLTRVSQGT